MKLKQVTYLTVSTLALIGTTVMADEVVIGTATDNVVQPSVSESSSNGVTVIGDSDYSTISQSSAMSSSEGVTTIGSSTDTSAATTPDVDTAGGVTTDHRDTTTDSTPNVDTAGGVTTDHREPTTDTNQTTIAPDADTAGGVTTDHRDVSQVGTTSSVTGQVVQDVTPTSPVITDTGVSIVSTQDGQVVLSDGTTVAPEAIGAVTNEDQTITVTKEDGTQATLPHTGEATSLLSLVGAALLGVVAFMKKKVN